MGKTYIFECSRCGYRARVSGGRDQGFNLNVETIVCRDCREAYDAVTRLKVPEVQPGRGWSAGFAVQGHLLGAPWRKESPPTFAAALNRLNFPGARRYRWLEFKLRCPVSAAHRIKPWSDPERCPRCQTYMDKHPLPFRLWD